MRYELQLLLVIITDSKRLLDHNVSCSEFAELLASISASECEVSLGRSVVRCVLWHSMIHHSSPYLPYAHTEQAIDVVAETR